MPTYGHRSQSPLKIGPAGAAQGLVDKVGAVTSAIQGVPQDTAAFNRFMHRHKKLTTD